LPSDVSQAALFLAPDAYGFVTATHLTVGCGITIGPRHSWHPHTDGPMHQALGISRVQAADLPVRDRTRLPR